MNRDDEVGRGEGGEEGRRGGQHERETVGSARSAPMARGGGGWATRRCGAIQGKSRATQGKEGDAIPKPARLIRRLASAVSPASVVITTDAGAAQPDPASSSMYHTTHPIAPQLRCVSVG